MGDCVLTLPPGIRIFASFSALMRSLTATAVVVSPEGLLGWSLRVAGELMALEFLMCSAGNDFSET